MWSPRIFHGHWIMRPGSEGDVRVALAWVFTPPQNSSAARLKCNDEGQHLRRGGIVALDVNLRTGFDQRLHDVRVSAHRRYEERRILVLRAGHDTVK